MSDPDFWGWVEPDEGTLEPGLYAYQTRPQIASPAHPKVIVRGFLTEMADIATAFSLGGGTQWDVAGYSGGAPNFVDGIGDWGANKNSFVWLYDAHPTAEETYVALADTSARPVASIDMSVDFTANLTYFDITGEGLFSPRMCRSVPPSSSQISFLATSHDDVPNPRSIYLIGSGGSPTIEEVITADDLHSGYSSISYYTWSADGRYLFAKVEDRLVILDRGTSTVVLDVVDNYSAAPQFSNDGTILYYTKSGLLYVRREVEGWDVDTIASEASDTFINCGAQNFTWGLPKLSPDGTTWLNIFRHTCGGLSLNYKSYLRFFDENFFLIDSVDVSAFASSYFIGDFSNDSRWFQGGDDNINGDSQVRSGPNPDWDFHTQSNTSTGDHKMRSFQAW